ncbi:MAG: hypothetical protein JRL30_21810 [Deltaproteobacteria bacterium]|nr:hypothetical protein [Deltaproteobacteria bacterium]
MNSQKKAIFHTKSMALLSCLIAAMTLSSCASELSTRASRVYMVSTLQIQKVESECEFLGSVTGASFLWGGCCLSYLAWRDVAYNNALNELLDNAAEIGATHVFVNLGTGEGLRGDAYRCTYCRGPDGKPDTAYCQGPDGHPDIAYCVNADGNRVGAAHCDGAEGKDRTECEKNCGRWIPDIGETACKEKGYRWVPMAENSADCQTKGGIWIPVANDQITCEGKGGTWVINTEVILPQPEEGGGK